MWLIHTTTLELKEFISDNVPPYAILSHTWGSQEVVFKDMTGLVPETTAKQGYRKIEETCRKAAFRGLGYAWVDTCCIDKSSSAELSESINSMYKWYAKAEVCFVYLEDISAQDNLDEKLDQCRWFTRGWTLQELIAPRVTEFYDKNWRILGTKADHTPLLSRITGIEPPVVKGTEFPVDTSVSRRMAWAARRKTTREEDLAYCLLGIFDVHMPLIYGEGGRRAFQRLQEEIIKRDIDATLFAWEPAHDDYWKHASQGPGPMGLLATCPAAFLGSYDVRRYSRDTAADFNLSNKGLRLRTNLVYFTADDIPKLHDLNGTQLSPGELKPGYYWAIGHNGNDVEFGIRLRKLGPGAFVRDGGQRRLRFHRGTIRIFVNAGDIVIDRCNAPPDGRLPPSYMFDFNVRSSVKVLPLDGGFQSRMTTKVLGEDHWDLDANTFLAPYMSPSEVLGIAYTLKTRADQPKRGFAVILDFSRTQRRCRVFDVSVHPRAHLFLFGIPSKSIIWQRPESVTWKEVAFHFPEVYDCGDQADCNLGDSNVSVFAGCQPNKEMIDRTDSKDHWVLKLEIRVVISAQLPYLPLGRTHNRDGLAN